MKGGAIAALAIFLALFSFRLAFRAPQAKNAGLSAPPTPTPVPSRALQKGMSYAAWWQGVYRSAPAMESLEKLAATGAEWLALVVTGYQETITSTSITRALPNTPTDQDLIAAIEKAHSLGMRVTLKPHLDLSADPAHWRGEIRMESEADWRAWFASYREFINHYAELAESSGVEQFCVGTELEGTSHREADWREVVVGVRRRFSGPLTYAANFGQAALAIAWWDTLDFIGVDAYYGLTQGNSPTAEELEAAWRGPLAELEGLARRYERPILITEIGYRSVDGANGAPWDWERPGEADPQEQAACYGAALQALWGQPWLAGIYWWSWGTDPQEGGPADCGYTPQGKPAEELLRAYYRKR